MDGAIAARPNKRSIRGPLKKASAVKLICESNISAYTPY